MSLKELRNQRGFSQSGVASLMGVKLRTVQRWENGETGVPTGRLFPLARTLDVGLDRLMEAISEVESIDASHL